MADGTISSSGEARRIDWSKLDKVKAELEAQFTGLADLVRAPLG